MAFVSVPKDLTKVKNKIILNLTKRQLICLGIAAAVGLPFYFLSRELIGSSNAATGMCLLMLPAFLFAMYEKDGLPLEKVLKNVIVVKFIRPPVRKYEVEMLQISDTVHFPISCGTGLSDVLHKILRPYIFQGQQTSSYCSCDVHI